MKNLMQRLSSLLFLFALGIGAVTPAQAKLKIVTTLPSFADIAQNVGGDEVEAVSLTRGNQDPHFVDARPDLILQLNKADLLIRVGLGLEDGWLPPLMTGSRNGRIQIGSDGNFEAATVIQLKDVPRGGFDRSMGDVHPGGNPHFMLDPRNGVIMARSIAERLSKLEPSKAKDFSARTATYVLSLEKKIKEWETALKPLKDKPVVTYHRSWTYFCNWLGMDQVGFLEPKPGIPPSPEHVVKVIHLMKERKVKLLLMEPYYPKGTAEHVAQETGAELFVLPTEVKGAPEATSYLGVFDSIVSKLKGVK